MLRRRSRIVLVLSIALLVVGLAIAVGLRLLPGAREARHLQRGDRYFKQQQYREASIAYQNVLQVAPTNAHAIRQLGLAHYQLGEIELAFRYLARSQELEPRDSEVRLRLAMIHLVARQPGKALEQVTSVLEKEPANLEALGVLAAAVSTPQEIAATLRRLEEARAVLGDKAKFHLALATLQVRNRNWVGAERALREAVAVEPTSTEAHTALGEFYASRGDLTQAERELKTAAALEPVGPRARTSLAEVYLRARRPDDAKRVLEELTAQAPDHLPAWGRLAEIALNQGRHDEGLRAVQVIMKKNPSSSEGHFIRGRIYLAQRKTTEAMQDLQKVLEFQPRFAPAHYHLGLAELQAGNHQQARWRLNEAATIDPSFTEAVLGLAELNIQMRAIRPAIAALEALAAKQPTESRVHVLLTTAYLANEEPLKATDAARKVVALLPKDPRGPYLVGIGLLAQGKKVEAAQHFDAALALAPDFIEPLAYLVATALAERKPDAALERVKQQITRVPASGRLHEVLGSVYVARGQAKLAETAFLKALELEPTLVGAYLSLSQLYVASGKHDEALATLNEVLKANPKNLVAHMRVGMLYEGKGDFSKAEQAYERALALDPRFAPAANNLAYSYSERGGDKERALQLARTAKEVAPDDPHISDTLGWILYKRGIYQQALGLLRESAAKLPENPEVQYHLGMAAYKAGDKEAARKALTRALASPTSFSGRDAAREALAALK